MPVKLPAFYTEARRALAAAVRVDEVKDIRDKAKAMEMYAQQAKDGDLIAHATEIRMRAEIRAGELLAEMGKTGARANSKDTLARGRTKPPRATKLADLGVNKTQSSRWQKLAAMPPAKQEATIRQRVQIAKAVAEGDQAVISAARAEGHAAKRKRRDERERELAAKIEALPDIKAGVIYADPEWRFEPWSRDTGMDRAADNHYPTSELDAIKSRDVASIAAPSSALLLWATPPMLKAAMEVMESWGFTYITCAVWVKPVAGTGYWFRFRHELLLLGTRGDVPCPAPGDQWDSVIEQPRGAHSEKPGAVYELIEHYFPNLPKIELNARKARKGWLAPWGFEAPKPEEVK